MNIDPHEIARRIQAGRRNRWVVWYGNYTRRYWALALWAPARFLEAASPQELIAAMNNFEMFHPTPR